MTTPDPLADFARNLFGTSGTRPPIEAPTPGNIAPREGSTPEMTPHDDEDMHAFVRELFTDND
jgi:hypothetical protein